MCLSLESLMPIIRTGLPILVELIDLALQMTLLRWLTFPLRSHSPALVDLFISSDASICSTMAFPPLVNSDHVVVSVSLTFHHIHEGMPHFMALLMTILVLIGTVFVII